MAAEHLTTWSPAAVIAAHTALLTLLDTGTGDASITVHATDDTLLATFVLSDPAGSVDGTTGALTLSVATQEDSAPAAGTADYASIRDADGTVHRSLPCAEGTEAVADTCVLNTLNIIAGGPVELLSAVIGG